MNRVLRIRSVLAAAALLGALALSCGDDDSTGNAPTGSISGTITFRGSTWPPTGNIYVTVNSSYPPIGAPDAFTGAITEDMMTLPDSTYDYTLGGIEVGTYVAVLIGWRGGPGNDKCIGMYWQYVDSLGVAADCSSVAPGPRPVTVTRGATTPDIDMVADLDLAQ